MSILSTINNQLTPYCRRPDDNEKEDDVSLIMETNIINKFTFHQLREEGITSGQLLSWSAPIDLVEQYERNNANDRKIFYNCSSPWFGLKCQYRFFIDSSLSFNEIVQATEKGHLNVSTNISITTCYPFLTNCYRGTWSLCLDWRQICDGQIDCVSEEDEQWCDILDMTECSYDQYRCHYGGQCIPLTFVRDSYFNFDCLDGSDEFDTVLGDESRNNFDCFGMGTFPCEERINRYSLSFPCGDGQFLIRGGLPVNKMRCSNKRNVQVALAMFTSLDHIDDQKCREVFRCSLHSNRIYDYIHNGFHQTIDEYFEGNWDKECELLASYCTNEWLVLPEQPIMYGYFQFVYLTNRTVDEFKNNVAPDFICFDAAKCPSLLTQIIPVEIIQGLTCCRAFDLLEEDIVQHFRHINNIFSLINSQCLRTSNKTSCQNESYFYCNESMKCIPYHRIRDGFTDCFYEEDEYFPTCQLNDTTRYDCQTDENNCWSPVAIGNGLANCPNKKDEDVNYFYGLLRGITLTDMCDNQEYLNGNETDETNCDWWPCYNPYSICNGYWDCPNGIDEINCLNQDCSNDQFQCINEISNENYCLPSIHMYHRRINDCTEFTMIGEIYFNNESHYINESFYSFNKSICINEDNICNGYSQTINAQNNVCLKNQIFSMLVNYDSKIYKIDYQNQYLCTLKYDMSLFTHHQRFLIPTRLGYFPEITSLSSNQKKSNMKQNHNKNMKSNVDIELAWYCHYGILIEYGDRNQTRKCLCPPNYFGSRCQWQNQRISLTLQFQMQGIISSEVIFQFIIVIIDQHGNIETNSEQLIYIPAYECSTKFNIYLLYPTRPKNSSEAYSIHIDLYDKSTLKYWTSWLLSIPHRFLPVDRIATQLMIPEQRNIKQCHLFCGDHGHCKEYENENNKFFCHCQQGYYGEFCDQTYKCQCSNDSLCVHPSICICPLNKFGSYCYLKRSICQLKINPCKNNGLCIPIDNRINLNAFICICKEGYHGERCQYKSNQIDIYINEDILINNNAFFIHYITAFDKLKKHERITMLKKVSVDTNLMTIYISQEYHIVFIQIPAGAYYLLVLREKYIPSEYSSTKLVLKQRCYFINEILNRTLLESEYLYRVKSYPLLCRQYNDMMCFYDEYNMCVCDQDRFSNCFLFNHTINYDCNGRNLCSNNGRCFQNNETCPTNYSCICSDCYYGNQCQFSTKGFLFSLDSILAYHIKPNLSINQQIFMIKLSIVVLTLMLIFGLVFGIFSLITFQSNITRQVGCGYYLLISSISSICMILILTFKFWFLILSQITLTENRLMLLINCILTEIIIKVFLALSEWLNACVALERMFNTMIGATFDKRRSQIIAKRVIILLFLFIILTYIHDPINRQLIDDYDIDQHRIWCFTKYSHQLNIYNTFITAFHFLLPFSINVICSSMIIFSAAYHRLKVQSKTPFKEHFHLQLRKHKHILIGPCFLILISLPRLIISITSGCMRSPRSSWLYLLGYFVSFIPSMLIFLIFILPSTAYRNEFDKKMKKYFRKFSCRRYFA